MTEQQKDQIRRQATIDGGKGRDLVMILLREIDVLENDIASLESQLAQLREKVTPRPMEQKWIDFAKGIQAVYDEVKPKYMDGSVTKVELDVLLSAIPTLCHLILLPLPEVQEKPHV